jgi:hypothetical protein
MSKDPHFTPHPVERGAKRGDPNFDGRHALEDCCPADETYKAKYDFDIAVLDVVPIMSLSHNRFFSSS